VSFRTIEDDEEVMRTDNIDYTIVEDYGFDLVTESFDFLVMILKMTKSYQ